MLPPTSDFIELDGETVALLLAVPNWGSVKVELTIPAEITRAVSGRQTRRNFNRFARYSIEYTADMIAYENVAESSTELRLWLNRLKGETVAVPLWADGCEFQNALGVGQTAPPVYSAPVRYGSTWVLLHESIDSYEIVTGNYASGALHFDDGVTLPWPAGTMAYPLLFGRLTNRPKFKADTDELMSGTIAVKENSSFDRRIAPVSGAIPTVGAGVPAYSSYKLWTVYPDYASVIDTTEADILYSSLGFLRQEQSHVYQQPPRRALEYGYSLSDRDQIAAIERLFVDRKGPTKVFFKPTFRGDMRLFSDLPDDSDAKLIPVEFSRFQDPDYAEHPGAPYIALVDTSDPNDIAVIPHKILTVDLDGLHTQVDVAATHTKETTLISHLILGCFAEAKITWTYADDGSATTTIKVIEQTSEYVTPNPDLTEKAFFFRITEKLPNAYNIVTLYTSYEAPITWPAVGTFNPAPISIGTITGPLDLSDKCELSTWDFDATFPIRKLLDETNEGPLSIEIWEASVDTPNDGSADEMFVGEIGAPDTSGKEWKVTCQFAAELNEGFGFFIQPVCNVPLFSPKCGLSKAAFKFTGTIASITGRTIVVNGPTNATGYFRIGHLETGVDGAFESRQLTSSTFATGPNRQTLTMNRPLVKAIVGQSIDLYPGCDFTGGTCRDVFDNIVNFRGHEYVPIQDVTAAPAPTQTGGKK